MLRLMQLAIGTNADYDQNKDPISTPVLSMRNQKKLSLYLARSASTGFSLVEIIVVLAALGILARLTLPNLLKMLQDSSNNRATAFMNSLAAECLQAYRQNTIKPNPAFDSTPLLLIRSGAPDDYKTEEGFDTCVDVLISPKTDNDTRLASYGFRMKEAKGGDPYIYKYSAYNHPDAQKACESWASYEEDGNGDPIAPPKKDCNEGGNVEEIRARLEAEAAERERLRDIQSRYEKWLNGPPPGSGNYTEDGKNVWAFRGLVVDDQQAYEEAVERACGRELVDALKAAKSNKYDGRYLYTSKNGGCNIDTYLCSGTEVGSKVAYDACKERERQDRCAAAEGAWKNSRVDGKFSEDGCVVRWQCNVDGIQEIINLESEYESRCGKKKQCPPRPGYCVYIPNHPDCKKWSEQCAQ